MISIADSTIHLAIAFMTMVLLAASVTDLLYHRIPNALLIPALAAALLLGGIDNGIGGLLASLAGVCVGLLILMPLYVSGGTSAGDVKLLGVVGAYLGPLGVFFAGMFTFIAGAVFGLLWIGSKIIWTTSRQHLEQSHIGQARATAESRPECGKKETSAFAYAPSIFVGSLCAVWYQGLLTMGG